MLTASTACKIKEENMKTNDNQYITMIISCYYSIICQNLPINYYINTVLYMIRCSILYFPKTAKTGP